MSEERRVSLSDFNSVPTEYDPHPWEEVEQPAGSDEFVVVTAREFAAVDEPGAEALVTAEGGSAIPVSGLVLIYGRDGAGKTTLVIDWALHLAAGVAWHGILDPARQLSILMIENEGPRREFRLKVRRRLAVWAGPEPVGLHVLEDPWARVSLSEERHRGLVADRIAEREHDLVFMGPLFSLGMTGGGTADDINDFVRYLDDVRARSGRPVSFGVVHHENRAGQVSGAWGPRPDSLVHVQPQGRGQLRVFWEKARWASALHGTATQLAWADGEAFEVVEREQVTEEQVWNEIAAFVLANGGCSWNTVDAEVKRNAKMKRRLRDRMIEAGALVNVGRGRGFRLWHPDDPARPPSLTLVEEAEE